MTKEREVHDTGYVGLERARGGVVVLGFGDARIPVLSKPEIRWLIEALERAERGA